MSKELRSRTFTWEDPAEIARRGASMDGLAFLQGIASGTIPAPPAAALVGLVLEEIAEGRAVFALEPQEFHYNPLGTVHGGIITTLLDTAMGCAVHSRLGRGRAYTTLELKVTFVRPLLRETGRVRAVAEVLHLGGKVAAAEARVLDGRGRLLSHATTTCLLSDVPIPKQGGQS